MAFEVPKQNETVEIGGKIYGHPTIAVKFPPNKNLKEVQGAMKSWNQHYERVGLRFSVVNLKMSAKQEAELRKMGGIPEELLGDRYTLYAWKFIDHTPAYKKTHPWVEYESYRDWQEAEYKKKHGKK